MASLYSKYLFLLVVGSTSDFIQTRYVQRLLFSYRQRTIILRTDHTAILYGTDTHLHIFRNCCHNTTVGKALCNTRPITSILKMHLIEPRFVHIPIPIIVGTEQLSGPRTSCSLETKARTDRPPGRFQELLGQFS